MENKHLLNTRVQIHSWVLGGMVILLSIVVWIQVRLTGGSVSIYDFYPLLGLLALSLMWTHYILDAASRRFKFAKVSLRTYFKVTSWIVLVLILLHPGLFMFQLWLDDFGLPPVSYMSIYTTPVTQFALILGSLSLLAFLAFELHRKYRRSTWWKYVGYANVLAMLAIFYHAITLGGELSVEWFQVVWYFYLITFIIAVGYNEWSKTKGNREQESSN